MKTKTESVEGLAAPYGAASPGQYRYRIKNMLYGSQRYGPCDVCKQHCAASFLQVEERFYRHFLPDGTLRSEGWTQHQCISLFGHGACLIAKRRAPHMEEEANRQQQP
jgi:hypothetical protein